MMRKRIGSFLLLLGLLATPAAACAQDLHAWSNLPNFTAPAAADLPPGDFNPLLIDAAAYIARAQDVQDGSYVPPVDFVGPIGHIPFTAGGIYAGAEFVDWIQTRPILSQTVAIRGFLDTNGTFPGDAPGTFVGSKQEALNTNQVQGSGSYSPGINIFIGYRFESGWAVDLEWVHLTETRYGASAGLIGNGFNVGPNLQNTFLFAPVVNFPIQFAGNPASVLVNGTPAFGATVGIWNAASSMSEQFLQRFEQVTINNRIPIWQTDSYRAYANFGPRAIILWEEYEWRTVQTDVLGQAAADTTANYSNIASNRLYGMYLGSGHDWYLGSTPVGAISLDVSLNGGLYLDFVKERAGYELGDKTAAANRSTNTTELSPGLDGKIGLMWYPWEAIQVRVGYSFMALFNTIASQRPIDFNFGTVDPPYSSVSRLFHGVDVGFAFTF